jgi:hypothetical protein
VTPDSDPDVMLVLRMATLQAEEGEQPSDCKLYLSSADFWRALWAAGATKGRWKIPRFQGEGDSSPHSISRLRKSFPKPKTSREAWPLTPEKKRGIFERIVIREDSVSIGLDLSPVTLKPR